MRDPVSPVGISELRMFFIPVATKAYSAIARPMEAAIERFQMEHGDDHHDFENDMHRAAPIAETVRKIICR